jgi:hypothetical protein
VTSQQCGLGRSHRYEGRAGRLERAGLGTLQTYPLPLEGGPSKLNIVKSTQISWLTTSRFTKTGSVFKKEQASVVGGLLSKMCPNGEITNLGRDKTGFRVKFKSVELITKFAGKTIGNLNKQLLRLERYFQRDAEKFVMLNVGSYEPKVLCEAFARDFSETLKKGEQFPKFSIRQRFVGRTCGTLNKQPLNLDHYFQGDAVKFVKLSMGSNDPTWRITSSPFLSSDLVSTSTEATMMLRRRLCSLLRKLRLEIYDLVLSNKNERDNGNGPISSTVENHKACRESSYGKRTKIYKLGDIGTCVKMTDEVQQHTTAKSSYNALQSTRRRHPDRFNAEDVCHLALLEVLSCFPGMNRDLSVSVTTVWSRTQTLKQDWIHDFWTSDSLKCLHIDLWCDAIQVSYDGAITITHLMSSLRHCFISGFVIAKLLESRAYSAYLGDFSGEHESSKAAKKDAASPYKTVLRADGSNH